MNRFVRGLVLLVLVAGVWAMWASSGTGLSIGRSKLYAGGEVGWYFVCTYLAAHRSFAVNFSEAALHPEDETTFFEKRADCPMFMHESRASSGWRLD